jgi:hypothetical protein
LKNDLSIIRRSKHSNCCGWVAGDQTNVCVGRHSSIRLRKEVALNSPWKPSKVWKRSSIPRAIQCRTIQIVVTRLILGINVMLILAGRPVLLIINLQELYNEIFNSLWPTIATFFQ